MPPAYEILLLNTAVPQIQAAQSGDTYVVPRDIAFSAALTLSAGTANGVPYLDGSKVLTTGSALTFDGTNLGVGGASAGPRIQARGAINNEALISSLRTDSNIETAMGSDGGLTAGFIRTVSNHPLVFGINNSEQMRLTSTGLGIGTSSPAVKLDVTGSGRFYSSGEALTVGADALAANTAQYFRNTSGYGVLALTSASDQYLVGTVAGDFVIASNAKSLRFGNAGTGALQATLDSSGNLGLGVTPSTLGRGKAFEVGSIGNGIWSDTGSNDINAFSTNAYLSTSNIATGWKFAYNAYAVQYRQTSGQHQWYTSTASGTAGNAITFSQVMTLDASGRLGIGVTSPDYFLDVAGDAEQQAEFTRTGTTTGASYARFVNSGGSMYFGVESSAGDRITNSLIAYASSITTSNATALVFGTNNTARAVITSGGDFQTSSGNSVMVGGTAARATTAGTNRLDIFDGTAPVGTLANGVSFYSASGEANVMDAAGNATLLSPHDAETNEWIFRSKHTPTGKVLKIDVERLLKFVNDHFGLDAVHEFIED